MRFPTPETAGVFLRLPERVKSAITNGGAAYYLIGDGPGARLRNNVGFHGAIAEFVDALLERAVLPYQTTQSLSSLSILPDVDLPEEDRRDSASSGLRCPVSFAPAIASAERRARLGHERRFAPREFWEAMIRGSDVLARVAAPMDLSDGYGKLFVYPSVLYPRQGEVWHYYWWEHAVYGFNDLVDTGWCGTTDFPTAWMPPDLIYDRHMESLSNLGRVALEVSSTLVGFYDGWPDSSLPMVAGLAGFDVPWWPWTTSPNAIHGGFQFAGRVATIMHFDWNRHPDGPSMEVTSSPYYADFAGDIEPSLVSSLAVAKAYNGMDGRFPAGSPWISPFDVYRSLATTPRANLDVLRIQQLLLGLFWANWARFADVVYAVSHRTEWTEYEYTVDRDGAYSTSRTVGGSRETTRENQLHWHHEVLSDGRDHSTVRCSAGARFSIDISAVEDYGDSGIGDELFLLDRLAQERYAELDAEVRDAEAQMRAAAAEAVAEKARAEAAKAAAQAAFDSALAGFVTSLSQQVVLSDINAGGSGFFVSGDYGYFTQSVACMVTYRSGSASFPFNRSVLLRVARPLDLGNDAPWDPDYSGLFSQGIKDSLLQYPGEFSERLLTGNPTSLRIRVGSNVYFDAPAGLLDALVAWHQACRDIEQAEADIADAEAAFAREHPDLYELATLGVAIDVSHIVRAILSDNHPWAYWVGGSSWLECPDDPVVKAVLASLETDPGAEESELEEEAWNALPPITVSTVSQCTRPSAESGSPEDAIHVTFRLDGQLGVRDISPWPAKSLVDGAYVLSETVAIGLTVHDHDVYGYTVPSTSDSYYESFRDRGSSAPDETFRRVAMMPGYGPHDEESPVRLARELLQAPFASFDTDTNLAPIVAGSFRQLAPIIGTEGAMRPHVARHESTVTAYYHPDKSPSWCSAVGPRGRRPHLIHVTFSGTPGPGYDASCDLKVGESEILVDVSVAVEYTTQSASIHGAEEHLDVDIKPEMAIRAEWNWKSMPVSQ